MTEKIDEAVTTYANIHRIDIFTKAYNELWDTLLADGQELRELKRKIPESTLKKLLENADAELKEIEKRELFVKCKDRYRTLVPIQTCALCKADPNVWRDCQFKSLQFKETKGT